MSRSRKGPRRHELIEMGSVALSPLQNQRSRNTARNLLGIGLLTVPERRVHIITSFISCYIPYQQSMRKGGTLFGEGVYATICRVLVNHALHRRGDNFECLLQYLGHELRPESSIVCKDNRVPTATSFIGFASNGSRLCVCAYRSLTNFPPRRFRS